jgi:Rrf2 family protein
MSLSLSTRGRYGVRFMAALAADWGRGSTLLRDISRREAVSEKYLGQIVIPLKASGLVTAHRGARGGYALARPPQEITVLDVVEAVEGPVAPVPCTEPGCEGAEGACDRSSSCAASEVWTKLRQDIRASLASVTLAGLAARARELAPPGVATYSI